MAEARLTDTEVDRIVKLLTTWQGKLSWELLLRRVTPSLGREFTRQGLDKQQSISIAFKQAKDRLRIRALKSSPANVDSRLPELVAAEKRIENLLAEIGVMKAEKDRLLERFATWLYNARSRGLTQSDLSQPLPQIDRDHSERNSTTKVGRKR
ncbi:hypothetical protein J2T08_003686 [Neorhizobium galegae]|uniref:hypothetical protein n=1 Tax=Neorhizobium galegae TaxID=399 RepID=UPI001AE84B60|nr:hypothetical protein [Neorhizobium galegae]MBP2558727.1 hypothetical protein [Neorhizobium galegae]MDQ0135765.1 hypothetical protein [Neorhizobium galegae]